MPCTLIEHRNIKSSTFAVQKSDVYVRNSPGQIRPNRRVGKAEVTVLTLGGTGLPLFAIVPEVLCRFLQFTYKNAENSLLVWQLL
jgi:hypothetical protein